MKRISEYASIQRFIDTIGKSVDRYFGKDEGAIIYLEPNGVWYAEGLHEWLHRQKKRDITLSTMGDDGDDLEEGKVRGRKVLLVDADMVTGKAYKRSMEAIRLRKKELRVKDIKFATYIDRVGLANFFVWKYSPESIWHFDEMNILDLKIIATLAENGREPFANIGKEVNLSAVTVKNRVDRLMKEKIIDISAQLHIDQFYMTSAQIYIEADEKTVEKFIEQFEQKQEVYHLVRVTGIYNLCVGIAAHSWHDIQAFIEGEIRSNSGVKKIFITTGEVPILPKTISPRVV